MILVGVADPHGDAHLVEEGLGRSTEAEDREEDDHGGAVNHRVPEVVVVWEVEGDGEGNGPPETGVPHDGLLLERYSIPAVEPVEQRAHREYVEGPPHKAQGHHPQEELVVHGGQEECDGDPGHVEDAHVEEGREEEENLVHVGLLILGEVLLAEVVHNDAADHAAYYPRYPARLGRRVGKVGPEYYDGRLDVHSHLGGHHLYLESRYAPDCDANQGRDNDQVEEEAGLLGKGLGARVTVHDEPLESPVEGEGDGIVDDGLAHYGYGELGLHAEATKGAEGGDGVDSGD